MTRAAIAAAICAVGLVAAAGVVALGGSDLAPASSTSLPVTSTPDSLRASAEPTATTPPPVPRGPLTRADADAAIPRPSELFGPADLQIELGSVCEGATFDLLGATPVYASLQSIEDPLQYLDAVVVVYDTVPSAETAYERIAEAIAECPPTRIATPEPTAPEERPVPIEIEGEVRPGLVLDGGEGLQWVQIQSADGTELRTAITVVLVANALVAVSMDEDSETIEADALADDSIAAAQAIVTALATAASRRD